MNLQETIIKVLRESKLPPFIRRRLNIDEDIVIDMLKKFVVKVFEPHKKIEAVIGKACANTAYELIDSFGSAMSDDEYYKLEKDLRDFLFSKYGDLLKDYINNYFDSSGDEYGAHYLFWKHADRYGGNGFTNSFPTWNKMLMEYGWWFPDLDWAELKQKLDSMPDRAPLLIKKPNDKNNTMNYYFSLLKVKKKPEMEEGKLRNFIKKLIHEETNKEIIRPIFRRLKNIDKLIKDTAHFTLGYFGGKHFSDTTVDEFVDRVVHNFYIDYVSPIFEVWDEEGELQPDLIITTEEKQNIINYFKNHYYETIAKYYRGMFPKRINEDATDTEYAVIEILKPSSRMPLKWYFQAVPLNKTEHDKIYIKRGPAGTLTISTKNIKIHKIFKKSEKEEMDKYLEKLRDEDKKKREQNESELTEKCWKGYTQKGMKTMFGKRYPNCVKKTK